MSFQAFFQSIAAPELRAIAGHWDQARGERRMPAWTDIDPVAIGRHLRYVWAWKYDRETDTFTGRLAGEDIVRAFGKSPRGSSRPMSTRCFSPGTGASSLSRLCCAARGLSTAASIATFPASGS
jgi:hypothetical protein